MFEQSVLPKPASRRPQTLLAVTAAEIVTIAVIALLPLFRIPALTPPKLLPVLRYVHSIPLVEVPSQRAATASVIAAPRKFYPPQRTPTQIANISEILPVDAAPITASPGMTYVGSDVIGAIDLTGKVPAAPSVLKEQPQTTEQQPVHVTSKIQEAKLVRKVIPVYPRLAIQTRQFGTVRLIATVGKDGRVKGVQVLSGPAFLAAAAVAAVKQWVYQPTLLNGNPVEVIAPIDVNFVLSQ